VRATALFNRLLGFTGTVVEAVSFTGHELLVQVRLRSKMLVCPCGRRSSAGYDTSTRRWRHVNLGRWKVYIQAEIRRVDCSGCGQVRTEWMPFARPGARHTQDFEDTAGWLCKRMSKAGTAALLRTSWQTIDAIVTRLVDTHLDDDRLNQLRRIGVDEIAYRKGRKFLTLVTDHDTGRVIWIGEGRSSATLTAFYHQLGAQRCAQIEATTMDLVFRAYAAAAAQARA
jgi:transposase